MEKCFVDICNKKTHKSSKYCSRHAAQLRIHGKIVSDKPSYKDLNEIRVIGDVAEIVLRLKMGDEIGIAFIDSDKVDLVKDKKWHLTSHGYCASKGKTGSWYLHRLVTGYTGNIDHISGDKLDNRLSNLRECNQSQNCANKLAAKNSKTGVKGVHPFKGGPKFAAQITKNKKVYCLGVFETVEQAACEYARKAKELFGEFART